MQFSRRRGAHEYSGLGLFLAACGLVAALLMPSLHAHPSWDVYERAEAQQSAELVRVSNPSDEDIEALGDRPITHLVAFLGDKVSAKGVRRLLNRESLVEVYVEAWRMAEVVSNLPSGLRHFGTLSLLRDADFKALAQCQNLVSLYIQCDESAAVLKELKTLTLLESVTLMGTGIARGASDQHYAELVTGWQNLQSLRLVSVSAGSATLDAVAGLKHVREVELGFLPEVNVAALRSLRRAPALKRLFIYSCEALDYSVWGELAKFSQLEVLEIKNCEATSPVFLHEVSKCPALTSLSILSTGLPRAGAAPPGRGKSLEFILEQNPFNGSRVPFENLDRLSLKNQDALDDAAFSYIIQAGKLRTFDISDCRSLTSEGLRSLARHAGLEQLTVFQVQAFTADVLLALVNGCALQEVDLTFVQGFDDSVAAALVERGTCKTINLGQSCRGLSSKGLLTVAAIKSLQGLNLRGRRDITVDVCRALGSLPNLTWLNLCETNVNDEGLQELVASKSLSVLGLHYCDVSVDAVRKLLAGGTVTRIGVSGCAVITGEVLSDLRQRFPNCIVLD